LALFARALDETGSQPVQLIGCTVRHLDLEHGLLQVPASAKGKSGSARRPGVSVPITPALSRDLAASGQANGKAHRLFTRPLRARHPSGFAR